MGFNSSYMSPEFGDIQNKILEEHYSKREFPGTVYQVVNEKIYIPGCFDPFYCSHDLYCALVEAKVWFAINKVARICHITSRNSDKPLTDENKKRLRDLLVSGGYPYEVVFDD